MEVVSEKQVLTPDTASLVVVEEERAGSQEEPEPLKDPHDIGRESKESSPDLTQFDDILLQVKDQPVHTSQEDVYY